MYQTNLKKLIAEMEVGETLKPKKGYREITIRNYASILGRELGRSYSVSNLGTLTIIRNA